MMTTVSNSCNNNSRDGKDNNGSHNESRGGCGRNNMGITSQFEI